MNRYAILKALRSTPFAMMPDAFAGLFERVLNAQMDDDRPPLEATVYEPAAVQATADAKAPKLPRVSGAIAVVPVYGVLEQRRSWYSDTSTDAVGRMIDGLVVDPSIGAIVLDIASPGGTVTGTPELADKIRGYRESGAKPVYGLANSMAASAAYWVGSQATKLFVSPSGEVGSIGVWTMHVDQSAWLEEMGVKVSLISAGKYKVEGNPFEPLEDEARAAIQADVDGYYGMFVDAVAKGRQVNAKTAKSDFGEGRMLSASASLAAGMVDGIATLPELLGAIVKPRETRQKALGASVAIQQAWDHRWDKTV